MFLSICCDLSHHTSYIYISFWLCSRYCAHVNQGGVRVISAVVPTAWSFHHREPDTGLAFKTPTGNHGEGASIIAVSTRCKPGECWELRAEYTISEVVSDWVKTCT